MNATKVVEKLSEAISAIEAFREAKKQYPKEAAAAEEMFVGCYPNRAGVIASIVGKGDE
jgi:hypothetical protein